MCRDSHLFKVKTVNGVNNSLHDYDSMTMTA